MIVSRLFWMSWIAVAETGQWIFDFFKWWSKRRMNFILWSFRYYVRIIAWRMKITITNINILQVNLLYASILLILGETGILANGLSHSSVKSGFLFDDVPITILSHQNWDFFDVPSFEPRKIMVLHNYTLIMLCLIDKCSIIL